MNIQHIITASLLLWFVPTHSQAREAASVQERPAALLASADDSNLPENGTTYYIRNNYSGQYLQNGANWGTRATLGNDGIPYTVTVNSDGKYALVSNVKMTGNALRPSDGYNDQSGAWELTATDGGVYMYNGSRYFCYDDTGIPTYVDEPTEGCVWTFETRDERVSALRTAMASATIQNPVDASFLLGQADFMMNDPRPTAWNGGFKIDGNGTSACAIATSGNSEKWDAGTFDVYQELTGLPAGIYRLSVKAFYRDGQAGTGTVDAYLNGTENSPVLYAGDVSKPIMSVYAKAKRESTDGWTFGAISSTGTWYCIPNEQKDADVCLIGDDYLNTLNGIVVDDSGTLRIGIRREGDAIRDWTVFDQFRLVYYGPVTNATLAELVDSLADFDRPCDATIYGEFADALADARQVIAAAESDQYNTAQKRVQNTYNNVCRSADEYAAVKVLLDRNDQLATNFTAEGAEVYAARTQGIRDDYDAGTLDIDAVPATIREAIAAALAEGLTPGTDLTFLLTNPDFDGNRRDGWILDNCTWTNVAAECAEMYEKNFNVYQDLSGLPVGIYSVKLQGFVRQGHADAAFANYLNGTEQIRAYIYGQSGEITAQTAFKSVYEGKDDQPHYTKGDNNMVVERHDSQIIDDEGNEWYIPNGMAGFSAWEQQDADRFAITATMYVTNGTLRIGAACDNYTNAGFWCIFDSFRLIYEGAPANPEPIEIEGNLLANGDMEEWNDDGTEATYWHNRTSGVPYSKSPMMLANSGQAAAYVHNTLEHDPITLQPGIYELSAWVRSMDAVAHPTITLGYGTMGGTETKYSSTLTTNEYTRLSATFMIEDEQSTALFVSSNSQDTDIAVLVDDVALVRTGDLPQMTTSDYDALMAIYDQNGGSDWFVQWRKDKDGKPNKVCTDNSYRGITIDEDGHITAINLSGFGLTGQLVTVDPETGTASSPLEALTHLQTLDVSDCALEGDVSMLLSLCPSLTTLNADNNILSENYLAASGLPVDYKERLSQRNQRPTQTFDLSMEGGIEEAMKGLPSICLDDEGTTSLTLSNQTWEFNGALTSTGGTNVTVSNSGIYCLWLEQPATFTCKVENGPSEGTTMTVALTTVEGDANMNGEFNVGDLQATISHIFGEYRHDGNFYTAILNLSAADSYEDHNINVQDVVACVAKLLEPSQQSNVAPQGKRMAQQKTVPNDEPEAMLIASDGQILLSTTREVAAIDITVTGGEPEWQLPGFTVSTRGDRSVIYSMTGATLDEGCHVIANLPQGAQVSCATIADRQGNTLSLTIDGTATCIDTNDMMQGTTTAYDLTGRPATRRSTIKIENGKTVIKVQK